MSDRETVIQKIEAPFAGNAFPGARFLQGSFEGCEPYDEVGPFEALEDWVERGTTPPASATVPRPQVADLVNTCSLG